MSYFNSHLKLCEILAYTLRTLYSTKKAKTLSGLVGDQWEQRVVTELDSAMNKWADSVPSHRKLLVVSVHPVLTIYSSLGPNARG